MILDELGKYGKKLRGRLVELLDELLYRILTCI